MIQMLKWVDIGPNKFTNNIFFQYELGKKWKCTICDKIYSSTGALAIRNKTVHSENGKLNFVFLKTKLIMISFRLRNRY
jgi:hypothetical protein